jgi:hypothetical protein
MRSLIFVAAAFLAVAAPGVAAAQTGGSVGLLYADLDDDFDPNKENAIGIEGVVLTETGSGWALGVRGASYDMDHGGHSDGFSQVEVSASYQLSEMIAVGGHVGQFNFIGSPAWTYGVSARADINQFSVAASASIASPSNSGADDATNFTIEGSMAVTENIGVSIHGSWSDFDGTEVDSYGIAAGYAFAGTGFELGAFYRQSDGDFVENTAIGLRLGYRFGDDMRRRDMLGSEHLLYDAIAGT